MDGAAPMDVSFLLDPVVSMDILKIDQITTNAKQHVLVSRHVQDLPSLMPHSNIQTDATFMGPYHLNMVGHHALMVSGKYLQLTLGGWEWIATEGQVKF